MFKGIVKKVIGMVLLICLSVNILLPYSACAQPIATNVMPAVSIAPAGNAIDLPYLKGIRLYKDNPFVFDFMISENKGRLSDAAFKEEADKLIKYFLASVTIPENDLWVNLSPYEPDRIANKDFAQSLMGGDLLAQDYMLKQISASLTHPDTQLGKEYWAAIAENRNSKIDIRKTGSSNFESRISNAQLNEQSSFNKVWIVPQKAVIYEGDSSAVIGETKLKVMVEQDYKLSDGVGAAHRGRPDNNGQAQGPAPTDAFKQNILPAIEKQVNEGQGFASLRQIYSAVILSTWYKNKLRKSIEKNLLKDIYVDKKKVNGVNMSDPNAKEKIYQQYLQAFKDGAYNLVKTKRTLNKITKRAYFSGGANLGTTPEILENRPQANMPVIVKDEASGAAIVTAGAKDATLIISGDGTRMGTRSEHSAVNQAIFKTIELIGNALDIDRVSGEYALRQATKDNDGFLWVDQKTYTYLYPVESHGVKKEVLIVVGPWEQGRSMSNHWGRNRDVIYAEFAFGLCGSKISHELAERDFIIGYALEHNIVTKEELAAGVAWSERLDKYLSQLPVQKAKAVADQAEACGRAAEEKFQAGRIDSSAAFEEGFLGVDLGNPFVPKDFSSMIPEVVEDFRWLFRWQYGKVEYNWDIEKRAKVWQEFFRNRDHVITWNNSALRYGMRDLMDFTRKLEFARQSINGHFYENLSVAIMHPICNIASRSRYPGRTYAALRPILAQVVEIYNKQPDMFYRYTTWIFRMMDAYSYYRRTDAQTLYRCWEKYYQRMLQGENLEGAIFDGGTAARNIDFETTLNIVAGEQSAGSERQLIVAGTGTRMGTKEEHGFYNTEIARELKNIGDSLDIDRVDHEYDFRQAVKNAGGFLWADTMSYMRLQSVTSHGVTKEVLVIVSPKFKGHWGRNRDALYAPSEAIVAHELAERDFLVGYALEEGIISQDDWQASRPWAEDGLDRYLSEIEPIDANQATSRAEAAGRMAQVEYNQRNMPLISSFSGADLMKSFANDSFWKNLVFIPSLDIKSLGGWGSMVDRAKNIMELMANPFSPDAVNNFIQKLDSLMRAKSLSGKDALKLYASLKFLASIDAEIAPIACDVMEDLYDILDSMVDNDSVSIIEIDEFVDVIISACRIAVRSRSPRYIYTTFIEMVGVCGSMEYWRQAKVMFARMQEISGKGIDGDTLWRFWDAAVSAATSRGGYDLSAMQDKFDELLNGRDSVYSNNVLIVAGDADAKNGGVSLKENEVNAAIEMRRGNSFDQVGKAPEFHFNLDMNNFAGLTPVILKITRAPIRM